MDSLLESAIRNRQLELWIKVTELYEISPELNARVHKWIMEGIFSEQVRNLPKKCA